MDWNIKPNLFLKYRTHNLSRTGNWINDPSVIKQTGCFTWIPYPQFIAVQVEAVEWGIWRISLFTCYVFISYRSYFIRCATNSRYIHFHRNSSSKSYCVYYAIPVSKFSKIILVSLAIIRAFKFRFLWNNNLYFTNRSLDNFNEKKNKIQSRNRKSLAA